MARIVTIANQKGGVGKTTTAMNLGVALSRQGKRVLLVDSDPQANLTSYLGITPGAEPFADLRTLDEMYLSKRPIESAHASEWIARAPSGVEVVASDRNLTGVEYFLFSRPDKEYVLSAFLSAANAAAAAQPEGSYDYILIDTPPSLNLLTLNALCASNHVLVPVQPEFFSLEGIVKIRDSIADIKERFNPKLSILGVLATQVSARRSLTQEVLTALKGELGDLFFESMIHDNAAVTESSGHARAVFEYDRGSRGAKDYLAAAQELLNRLD